MATGGKLEVQIGADVTDLQKGISEAELLIRKLQKEKSANLKLGLDVSAINPQLDKAKANLKALQTQATQTAGAVGTFNKSVGNGNSTLMQFSRIAQDAPFGIMGIGNNITATAESFGYLKQQTGSTSGALKAMASSLMGTGGILLGVSLLTTGLTLLSQSGLTVGDIINKITGDFDEFGATINKISIDAAKNSGQEIASVKALISVAQDDLKSRKDRLTAVEELQNQYPGYFGNLNKEKILNGDLTAVTKELSKAIIARAEATAIADKIGELAAKKLDLQIKKEKEVLRLQKAQKGAQIQISSGGTLGADANISNQTRLADATADVKDINQEIYDIQLQQDKLADRLNKKTADSIKLLEKKEAVVKPKKAKPTRDQFGSDPTSQTAFGLFDAGVVEIPPINGDKAIQSLKDFNLRAGTEFTMMMKLLEDFNLGATEIINNGISNAFAGIGSAIGQAMANGSNVMQALGSTLLSSLGGILTDMGKMAIQVGVGLLGIKAALKTLNPAVAIAAGVGLIALGSFFSAKSSSIGGSMGSGSGSGTSTATGSGANNSSTSGGNFGWSGGGNGTVVFEIAGTSLIGVLNNTTERNLRIGGR